MNETPASGKPVLAIDLGGTKILAALVDGATVLGSRRTQTPRQAGPDQWLDAAAALVGDWQGRFDRAAIAVTGGVSQGAWYPLNPQTLPIPFGYPLVDELSRRLSVPVAALNDGQAAAWGEYRHGAGQNADMVFLTISTGIGGGIVLNGRLLSGRHGLAGHIGITKVATEEGEALLEALGSGSALARLAAPLGRPAEPPAIFAAAENGERWALDLVDRVVAPVAREIANLQLLLDPDCFVIGGGMGLAPLYLARLTAACETLPDHLRPILRAAALGANAGLIGIADRVKTNNDAQQR